MPNRASATLGVKCRGVPTSHAAPAPIFEPGVVKAPMSRAPIVRTLAK